jgi:hypothetical protein
MKAGAFSLPRIAALMPPVFGRTHASTMPAGFDAVRCVRLKAFYAAWSVKLSERFD